MFFFSSFHKVDQALFVQIKTACQCVSLSQSLAKALLASECVVSSKGIIENNDEILEESKVSTLLIVSAWTCFTDLKVLVIMQ